MRPATKASPAPTRSTIGQMSYAGPSMKPLPLRQATADQALWLADFDPRSVMATIDRFGNRLPISPQTGS